MTVEEMVEEFNKNRVFSKFTEESFVEEFSVTFGEAEKIAEFATSEEEFVQMWKNENFWKGF